MRLKNIHDLVLPAVLALASGALILAQQPAGGKGPGGPGQGKGGRGPGGPVFTVTSPSFPDGSEVPVKFSFYGENKSPEFNFVWMTAGNTGAPPAALQSYAVIFHDIENATAKGPTDTLHWSAFNIPELPRVCQKDWAPVTYRMARVTALASPPAVEHPLLRAGRRSGSVPSLRVRVLRSGYETGSSGEDHAGGSDEGDGRPRHRQSCLRRTFSPGGAIAPNDLGPRDLYPRSSSPGGRGH